MLIARRKPRSKLAPVKGVDPLHCKNGGILSAVNRFESEINATIMQVSDTPTITWAGIHISGRVVYRL